MSGRDAEDILQAVLDRLDGVRQQGGYWMARCPAHEDRQPSLSVRRGDRQPVILKCHAGCDPQDVANAIGLDLGALCVPRDDERTEIRGDLPPGAIRAYVYHDAAGQPVFRKLRFEPKRFSLQPWDGSRWGRGGIGTGPRPLYRLPDVLAAVKSGRTVYVCEGEKDADAVRATGETATCNFDGAAKKGQRPKVRAEYAEPLRGADVVVVADDDEPGLAHARAWFDLLSAGAAQVRLTKPASGKDASDHLSAGKSLSELVIIADTADEDEDEAELPDTPPFPHELARGPLLELLNWAAEDGLPVSYVAAAAETIAGAAAARTLDGGRGATIRLGAERRIYPVLWQALIGDSGAAKNPPIRHAKKITDQVQAGRVANWQAECEREREDAKNAGRDPVLPPRPQPLAVTSTTIEAQARWLMQTGGGGLVTNGELASWLKSFGQYKGGGGSDRYDAMDIWSCEAIYQLRVGDGGAKNGVVIDVPEPRLSVIGGLVTDNLHLLGSDGDGLRARILPVLASSVVIPNLDGEALPEAWCKALRALHSCAQSREWHLVGEAREAIREATARWLVRKQNGTDPKVVRTALAKADEQCLRIALIVAEIAAPGAGGDIPLWAIQYGIARVEYALGCWLALGSDQVMAFSRRDEILSRGVDELRRQIESRPMPECGRRYMTRREIQRAMVGGARTPQQIDDLLRAYCEELPGCVTVYSESGRVKYPRARLAQRAEHPDPPKRGPADAVVWAPRRVAATPQRADEKLSALTVFSLPADRVATTQIAGQSVTVDLKTGEKLSATPPADSYLLTVSGADEATGDGDEWRSVPPPDDPWAGAAEDMTRYRQETRKTVIR